MPMNHKSIEDSCICRHETRLTRFITFVILLLRSLIPSRSFWISFIKRSHFLMNRRSSEAFCVSLSVSRLPVPHLLCVRCRLDLCYLHLHSHPLSCFVGLEASQMPTDFETVEPCDTEGVQWGLGVSTSQRTCKSCQEMFYNKSCERASDVAAYSVPRQLPPAHQFPDEGYKLESFH